MSNKNSRGAMEMSVGTIVTIVLLMSVLVLGLFFIQKIFHGASGAIDSVNAQLTTQLNQMFSNGGTHRLAIQPSSRQISLKKGDSTPRGFAFSVHNNAEIKGKVSNFNYTVSSESPSDCGKTITKEIADSYIVLGKTGSFKLDPGDNLDLAEMVLFTIPKSAVPCTIGYNLEVDRNGKHYTGAQIGVTIK